MESESSNDDSPEILLFSRSKIKSDFPIHDIKKEFIEFENECKEDKKPPILTCQTVSIDLTNLQSTFLINANDLLNNVILPQGKNGKGVLHSNNIVVISVLCFLFTGIYFSRQEYMKTILTNEKVNCVIISTFSLQPSALINEMPDLFGT